MVRRNAFVVLGLMALALAGCGNRRPLKTEAGQSLPPAPYGRAEKPNADDLLSAPVQARPQRSVELRSRSQDREDDPFDLPPEN